MNGIAGRKMYTITKENCFAIAYFSYLCLSMYGTTMFMELVPVSSVSYKLVRTILAVSILVQVFAFIKRYTVRQILLLIIFGAVISLSVVRSGNTGLFDVFVLFVGALKMEQRDILKIYLIVSSLFLCVSFVCSMTGVIQDYIVISGGKVRHSFGFIYPTDFAAHCLYLWLTYLALTKHKISLMHVLFSIVAAYLLFHFCMARLNAGLFLLSGFSVYILEKNKKVLKNRMMRLLITYLFPIFMVLSLLLPKAYNPANSFWNTLNIISSNRLSQGRQAIIDYGYSLFGQHIRMQGYGWTKTGFDYEFGYFFIDSGYLRVALQYGLILLLLICLGSVLALKEYYKEENWRIIIVLSVLTISYFIDHHIMEIAYNPFLFIYMTSLRTKKVFIKNQFIEEN